jgi:hypothetical protein
MHCPAAGHNPEQGGDRPLTTFPGVEHRRHMQVLLTATHLAQQASLADLAAYGCRLQAYRYAGDPHLTACALEWQAEAGGGYRREEGGFSDQQGGDGGSSEVVDG